MYNAESSKPWCTAYDLVQNLKINLEIGTFCVQLEVGKHFLTLENLLIAPTVKKESFSHDHVKLYVRTFRRQTKYCGKKTTRDENG